MIPEEIERTIYSNNGILCERFLVDIPQSEMMLFQLFADKMGWQVSNRKKLWDEYISSSTENMDLSEEEIMEEVRAVRYGKTQGNY